MHRKYFANQNVKEFFGAASGRVSSASVYTSCRKWGAENEIVFTRAGSSKAASSVGEEEEEDTGIVSNGKYPLIPPYLWRMCNFLKYDFLWYKVHKTPLQPIGRRSFALFSNIRFCTVLEVCVCNPDIFELLCLKSKLLNKLFLQW